MYSWDMLTFLDLRDSDKTRILHTGDLAKMDKEGDF